MFFFSFDVLDDGAERNFAHLKPSASSHDQSPSTKPLRFRKPVSETIRRRRGILVFAQQMKDTRGGEAMSFFVFDLIPH
jgi:hypothetical protein